MSSWQPKKRERVKAKTNGRCAYCGDLLGEKFHVDHIRSVHDHRESKEGLWDREHNLHASCAPCNLYKSSLSLEEFRDKIHTAHDRLTKHAGYRAMMRYRKISPVFNYYFYFETLDHNG